MRECHVFAQSAELVIHSDCWIDQYTNLYGISKAKNRENGWFKGYSKPIMTSRGTIVFFFLSLAQLPANSRTSATVDLFIPVKGGSFKWIQNALVAYQDILEQLLRRLGYQPAFDCRTFRLLYIF